LDARTSPQAEPEKHFCRDLLRLWHCAHRLRSASAPTPPTCPTPPGPRPHSR
jgi:hypothetical protein